MTSDRSGGARQRRARLRRRIAAGDRLLGTFVKLATTDVLDLCEPVLDLVVLDMEHSRLDEAQVVALLRHADGIGLPALVRVPVVEPGLVNRLLEAGAVGIQLSMLASVAQRDALRAACNYAPNGVRSISLAHPTAAFGGLSLADYLAAERAAPPLLIGQIESEVKDDLADVITGLDVAFVGTTDLMVSRGLATGDGSLGRAVAEIARCAANGQVAFGGWSAQQDGITEAGLQDAAFVLLGSDLQVLAASLRQLAT